MSTRHARVADKELNEKHTRILVELLQRPENKICADCKKKDPRWASWNLGVFICIRCSGTHRSMGTHISKVKSVDLDTWVPEQIENMIKWGNQRANVYWAANMNDALPTEYGMDRWIRDKYEKKKWIETEEIISEHPTEQFTTEAESDTAESKNLKKQDDFKEDPIKDLSKEFDLLHKSATANQCTDDMLNMASGEASRPSSIILTNSQIEAPSNIQKKSTMDGTTCNGYKFDMGSFQEQLSGLSLGKPSSGLIPRAPPGSNTSWTNFLIGQSNPESSALSQPSTEKPLIPYDVLASLRR